VGSNRVTVVFFYTLLQVWQLKELKAAQGLVEQEILTVYEKTVEGKSSQRETISRTESANRIGPAAPQILKHFAANPIIENCYARSVRVPTNYARPSRRMKATSLRKK
jgi:hypothetical protein